MDLQKLADILIDKIRRDYQNDISIVHVHGSHAYGDTHERSDLDLYFVPKTPHGFQLGCSFILDGIGCDFWALSWERLEQIAAHEEKTASIITEGQVLYYGSEEDFARFERLKACAVDVSDRNAWFRRARKILDEAYKDGFLLQNAESLSEVRTHAIGMLYNLSFALAQLNQVTVKRGRRLLKQEILSMPLVPKDFAALYETVFFSNDMPSIKMVCITLLQNTETLVAETIKAAHPAEEFAGVFDGWYEEMIQSYNKIYHACETGDVYTPLFAGVEFSSELAQLLKQTGISPELPDMVAAYDNGNLNQIAEAARRHQAMFETLLHENGVRPLRFSNFEEVENFLNIK